MQEKKPIGRIGRGKTPSRTSDRGVLPTTKKKILSVKNYNNIKMDGKGKYKRVQVPLSKKWAMFMEFKLDDELEELNQAKFIMIALKKYYGKEFLEFIEQHEEEHGIDGN